MDSTTRTLVEYALGFTADELTEAVEQAAVTHLVDSIAVAIAGSRAEPATIAVDLARSVSGTETATVFGTDVRSTPELAAFANTVMIRAWDWNDGMFAKGGGHPSDMVSALVAAAEVNQCTGRSLLTSMALSYEVLGALGDVVPIRDKGWDQGTFMSVACALGVGRLYGLSEPQLANAVSIALVPSVPLRVTRTGELSMWKGCATAAACRNAVFAVQLARRGMTGPAEPFEGATGLWQQVTGPFEVILPRYPDGPRVIELSALKKYPSEAHSQALLGFMPEVREWTPVDEIEAIEIEIYWQAYHEIGSHPSKWDPQTRETADHSLPYLLAAALTDGGITLDSFRPERFRDPSLRPLMSRISVSENPEYTAAFRPPEASIAGAPKAHITIRNSAGEELRREITYAKGHSKNPMLREDLDAKFDMACHGVVDDERKARIRDAWWEVATSPDVAALVTSTMGAPY